MRSTEAMKRSCWLLLVPILGACGSGEEKTAGGGPVAGTTMKVQSVVLQPTALDNEIIVTGSLLANEEVLLISELPGRVTSINFEEGGKVRAGQVLVTMDHADLQAQLRQAEANLHLALEDERRREQLLAVNGISQQQLDEAKASRIGLEAEADLLRTRISRATIRAPFSGEVGLRNVSLGSFVQPGDVLARLVQVDPIKLEFAVPERLGRGTRPGNSVTFSMEGTAREYEGEIYAVEPSVDPATRSIRIRARSSNPEGRLMPGSFVRVKVELDRIDNALLIPTEGLIPDIHGQKVMVVKDGKAVSKRVEVGIRQPREVQITEGVSAGDTVIVTGLLAVREGMAVDPIPMAGRDAIPTSGTDSVSTAARQQ